MAKKTDKIIEPIKADFDKVVKKLVMPATQKQGILDLGIEIEKDVGGVEMGVLENGIPFLTQRGLAAVAGVHRSVIYDITQEWAAHIGDQVLTKDRLSFLKAYLSKHGYNEPQLYIETITEKTVHYSYPDVVCMAVLEYYAFEAKPKVDSKMEEATPNTAAIDNYRRFAAYGLRKFIYEALDYTPSDKWRYYHDRVSLLKAAVPNGYFCVFNEIPGMVVDLINADLTVNHKTIPDISVGIHWAAYWKANHLAIQYTERINFDHEYPPYYPQAKSNPQKDTNAYPDAALPEFRQWFKSEYLPTKFPTYILSKANILPGGKQEAVQIANIYQSKQISGPKKKS